jgi:hypothetical protein
MTAGACRTNRFGTSPDPGAGTAPGSFEGVVLVGE